MYGRAYLISKLGSVSTYVSTRYAYYKMKNENDLLSISIPMDVMKKFRSRLGWCTKAVDLLGDRLSINRFKNDNFGMQDLYELNNSDILFSSAIKGALISGCDFIYIYKNDDNEIKMQVVGGKNATGILDDTTHFLTEGYAILSRNPEDNSVILDAYFTPEYTEYKDYKSGETWRTDNPTGYCLLVPIINHPEAGDRQFGCSRISKAMMNVQNKAEKLMTETAVLAEVNSWPQKWITGLAEGTEVDTLRATFSSMLKFGKDDDGDRPTLGQFTQMSFNDHISLFDSYVSDFSGISSLTRDDLGYVTENPSSAESKKAALESLRVIASQCQRDFSVGFLNAGFVASCLRDGINYSRTIIRDTKILWKPLVEPDASTLSSIGDGIIKINQAVPNYFTAENVADLLGIETSTAGVETDGLFDFATANS